MTTNAETDRLETFLHAADERGLAFAVETVYRLGVSDARRDLTPMPRRPAILCRRDLRRVAGWLGMELPALLRRCRAPALVRERSMAMWICRQLGHSYSTIGRVCRMNHASAMAACRRVERDAVQVERGRALLAKSGGERARAA